MAIAMYLAMTAAEFSTCEQPPSHTAWLACHFSPSGPGLSNIPKALPADSVMIVDDSTPFQDHRADVILGQLQEAANTMQLRAIILDFQRTNTPNVQDMVATLQKELPCPVAATPEYAGNGAVFLPPCPLDKPLKTHLAPYQGRQIWLDAAPLPMQITVTTKGSESQVLSIQKNSNLPHWESNLCCHYNIELKEDRIVFTLIRDHERWLAEAECLGVTAAVGLFQEWK